MQASGSQFRHIELCEARFSDGPVRTDTVTPKPYAKAWWFHTQSSNAYNPISAPTWIVIDTGSTGNRLRLQSSFQVTQFVAMPARKRYEYDEQQKCICWHWYFELIPASITKENANNDCNNESNKKESEVQNSITNNESDQPTYFAIHRMALLYSSPPIPSPINCARRGVAPLNGGAEFEIFNMSNITK